MKFKETEGVHVEFLMSSDQITAAFQTLSIIQQALICYTDDALVANKTLSVIGNKLTIYSPGANRAILLTAMSRFGFDNTTQLRASPFIKSVESYEPLNDDAAYWANYLSHQQNFFNIETARYQLIYDLERQCHHVKLDLVPSEMYVADGV